MYIYMIIYITHNNIIIHIIYKYNITYMCILALVLLARAL